MKAFDLYNYSKSILSEVGLKDIKRCSGLMNLEEVLSNISNLKPPLLVVENSSDGYFNLTDRNFDNNYFNIFFLAPAKTNNAEDIHRVVNMCKSIAKQYFLKMKQDEEILLNDNIFLNADRISYSKIGPLISNFWGFSIGFELTEDFSYYE